MKSSKTAVVTGAGSGIGAAIAAELTARGYQLMLADIDGGDAERVAGEVGGNAIAAQCDVADHAAVERLAELTERRLGRVDRVFANAGVSYAVPLLDSPVESFDWVFGVNIRGVWSTAVVFGKRMRDSGHGGRLCLTASEHALGMQFPGSGIYTASKHAVLGMGDVLRSELPENMTVSIFCPGLVSTNIHLSKKHSPLPLDDEESIAFASAFMAKGMDPTVVAKAAVDGTERGDFLIVTHPTGIRAAEKRWDDVRSAFERQAPITPESEQYELKNVLAALAGEAGSPFTSG